MQSVVISVGSEIEVEAPYSPRFHDGADELGGTFIPDRDVWRFARGDEDRVRRLCGEVFSSEVVATTPCIDLSRIADAPVVAAASNHQRRANLLDRLDSLLHEVAEIHSALQTLDK